MKCKNCDYENSCIYEKTGICLATEDLNLKICKVFLQENRPRIYIEKIERKGYEKN